jgi:8-oxo-dGTP pyrophosphatase MutT (NUDIX family)
MTRTLRRLLLKFEYAGVRLYWRLFHPVTLGVRVMLIEGDRVLLVQHTYQSGWFLPGGGIKKGETLEDAARRESFEEVGAVLGPLQLLGIYSSFLEGKSDHVAVFVCSSFHRDGSPDAEIAQTCFFPIANPPPEVSPGTRDRLADYTAGRRGVFGRW